MTSIDADSPIRLESEDGMFFELSTGAASLSSFVSDALNDDGGNVVPTVKVLRVKSDCLHKVVEFLIQHKEEPMKEIPLPLGSNSFTEIVPQKWYQQFVADDAVDQDMLFDLITAGNYMGIKPLIDLTCLKATFMLSGKSAEQIRRILHLPKATREEDAHAREHQTWIYEQS